VRNVRGAVEQLVDAWKKIGWSQDHWDTQHSRFLIILYLSMYI
jgi:hypothetical protein